MNIRIKELLDQADAHGPGGLSMDRYSFSETGIEQFAELIVKECARVQHVRFCQEGDVSWDLLMHHFGIKE